MPLLDKAYANALLFSVGLLLGSAGESDGSTAKDKSAHAGSTEPRSASRSEDPEWGTESEALAALRRGDDKRFFGKLDDLTAELEMVNERLDTLDEDRGDDDDELGLTRVGPGSPEFWDRLRMPAIPFQPNTKIERYVRFFTESAEGRKTFVSWLKRSGQYRDIVLDTLERHELPPEIIAVAFIESGFRPTAVSTAGATGLWQFMPKTARAYGLSVGRRHDERRSIWRSTDAAARHLSDLYAYFRSWELALAAYNYGYERLAGLSERMATRDFWALSAVQGALPRETATYVPKVLAVAVILNNLERFDLNDVRLDEPLKASPLQVPPGTRMSLIARAAGTSLETIRAMNPEYRRDVTPPGDRASVVHVPASGLARARVMLPRLLESADADGSDTTVPSGFNWGRDDPEEGTLDRLSGTIHGGRQAPEAPGYLRQSRSAAGYFDESDAEVDDPVSVSPHDQSTANEVVSAASEKLACSSSESPVADLEEPDPQVDASPITESPRGKKPGKRRVKARTDRQIIFYLAARDDTVEAVARRFDVDQGELRRVNRMAADDALSEGTLLRVPVLRADALARRASASARGE